MVSWRDRPRPKLNPEAKELAKLELDKTLSPDKVLLCGASTKTATIDEIEFSLVVHMEVA